MKFFLLALFAFSGILATSCSSEEKVAADVSAEMDTVSPPDTISDTSDSNESDVSCEDPRKFGDGKLAQDRCWDPPLHYCSQGASTIVTYGCNEDNTLCCQFGMDCLPCGWHACSAYPCTEQPGGWCGDLVSTNLCSDSVDTYRPWDDAECLAIKPDVELEICWDDVN